MQYCKLPLTISILACTLAENRTNDEISLLATLFTQLGDTLATIAVQQDIASAGNSVCANQNDPTSESNCKNQNDSAESSNCHEKKTKR